MKNLIKNFLKRAGPSFLFYKKSYAQEGEDLAVNRLLKGKRGGFYIEVGAHHPYRFSNTYFFYRKGWSGVCIDPLPGTKQAFKRARPRDIALECGISIKPDVLRYYMFNESALNTFDNEVAKERDGKDGYKLINTLNIETRSLTSILENISIPGSGIDLLSVDAEGFDYEVLMSLDWSKYSPKIIICECLQFDFNEREKDPVFSFLINQGYVLYAKTGHSMIFTKNSL